VGTEGRRFSSNASLVRFYLGPEIPFIIIALVCALLLGVVSAIVAALVGPALQIISAARDAEFTTTQLLGESIAKYLKIVVTDESFSAGYLLSVVPLALISVSVVKALVSLVQWYLWEKTGEKTALSVRRDIVRGYLFLDPMMRKTDEAQLVEGDLSSTITNDVRMLREYIVHFYGGVPRELFSVLTLATTLVFLSPKLFLIFVVGILPAAAVISRLGKKLRKRASKALLDFSVLSEWIQQRLLGIETIKHYRTEAVEISKMQQLSSQLYKGFLKASSVKARTSPMLQAVAVTSLGGVLIVALGDIASGETTGAIQLSFFATLALLSQSAGKLGKYMNTNREASSAVDRLRSTMNYLDDHCVQVVLPEDRHAGMKTKISAKNVSVRYPDQKNLALKDFSYDFVSGKIYCLAGSSGAGKSTLLGVLLGIVRPESGEVERDIVVKHSFELCYQPQKVLLLPGTVGENISYPTATFNPKMVEECLRRVGMYEVIEKLPNGIYTPLGTGGSGLSGGQAQRIMLARLWYHKSPLVFIDEGTSALDPVIEQLVYTLLKDLRNMGSIVISIAHRRSMLEIADEVLTLEGGCLQKAH
jgi:ABC-type multidrug transport system fused ATPase/permease subunit